MATQCVLCGVDGNHERLCGCDLCTSCAQGHLEPGLARWGLSLEHKRWTEKTGGDNPTTVYCLEVLIRHPTTVQIEARFRREGSIDRVRKWFGHSEPQSRDDLFDRVVYVDGKDEGPLGELLSEDGFQSAVMELVASGGVRLGPGWARCRRGQTSGEPLLSEAAIPLLLIVVHIERWAAQKG